jgi:flagellum-specific ATP synthase
MVNDTLKKQSLMALTESLQAGLRHGPKRVWGTVSAVTETSVELRGVSGLVHVGDEFTLENQGDKPCGEILTTDMQHTKGLLFQSGAGIKVGDRVNICPPLSIRPCDDWIGKIVNFRGASEIGDSIPQGPEERSLYALPPPASLRHALGPRLNTGWFCMDTLLPLCHGQRIGLFAGSGVGKSTFLASMARRVEADIVIVALIGERSREVAEFVQSGLGPEGLKRAIVVTATSGESPAVKKRAAYCAMTLAEYFRDKGKHVLLVFDSITRFAEAHRETALLAGETPALHAFPPSTVRAIAELAERAGPGAGSTGDITAIFSVLVAGSNMEEPVADMIRGILDGHVVLSRTIAERGRYPAIDVLQSVSRALPKAGTAEELALLSEARKILAVHEQAAPMIKAGLYEEGIDPETDRALRIWPALDAFIAGENVTVLSDAFLRLAEILNENKAAAPQEQQISPSETPPGQ